MSNAFHNIKGTSTTEFWMPTIGTINEDLSETEKKTKDGSAMTNQLSLFERHDYLSMTVLSHQLRHMLNTMAKIGGDVRYAFNSLVWTGRSKAD